MNNYEDYFQEPGEFDQMVYEMKEALKKSVIKEITDEIEQLKVKVELLSGVQKDWDQIKLDLANKKSEMNNAIREARTQARRERLVDLFQDYQLVLYKVGYTFEKNPKCNLCDEYRRINLKTPGGKNVSASCDCDTGINFYSPKETVIYSFNIDDWSNKFRVYYKSIETHSRKNEYFEFSDMSSEYPECIYKDEKYDDITRKKTYFRTEEECQKFCDWLNETRDK